jgi:hypothetical protein
MPIDDMANFTTRVQLNGNPSSDDYEQLHSAMKEQGFSRIIFTENNYYWMPHAEYNRIDDTTIHQVRTDAATAAATVSNDFEILVTQGTRAWQGLERATPAEALIN